MGEGCSAEVEAQASGVKTGWRNSEPLSARKISKA